MAQETSPESDAPESTGSEAPTGFAEQYAEQGVAAVMILGGAFLFVFSEPIAKIAGGGLIVLGIVVWLTDWRWS